ncbi:hypothetical protein BH09BAC5_BH09BAC5_02380 [soil metagenome]
MKNLFCFVFLFYSHLIGFAQQTKIILPIGHIGQIYSTEYSPDGKKIVTAASDGTAKIWDANTGILLVDLTGHSKSVNYAEYSPDGKKIITASSDGTAKIWDASTGVVYMTLIGHSEELYSAKYSPDGKKIATYSKDLSIKLWDAISGTLLQTLIGHTANINSIQFSPDGYKILTSSDDGTAKIWDADNGTLIFNMIGDSVPHYLMWALDGTKTFSEFKSAQFSPDGKKIVTACSNKIAIIWDANTGSRLKILKGHKVGLNSAFFSPDGNKIVTTSGLDDANSYSVERQLDNTAKIWDANSGVLLLTIKGHSSGVVSAQFSPNSKTIVTISWDKTIKIWDANSGILIANLINATDFSNGPNLGIKEVDFSPDGKKFGTASSYGIAKIWDATTGKLFTTLKAHTVPFREGHFSPDGTKIVTVAIDHGAKVWDASNGSYLMKLEDDSVHVQHASFNKDGTKILTTLYNNSANVWDANTGKLIFTLIGSSESIFSAQFSPDGKTIVTAYSDYKSKLWDATTGILIADLVEKPVAIVESNKENFFPPPPPLPPRLFSMRDNFEWFSPDGSKVISITENNTANVWDTKNGKLITTLTGHNKEINCIQFSSDSKKIITASSDKTAKIWDANTGALIATLTGHTKGVNTAKFSPDNSKIVTSSKDNTTKTWNASSGTLIVELKGPTGNNFNSAAKFNPDGKTILTICDGDSVNIWDANSGTFVAKLLGHTSTIISAEFSLDGKSILTTSADNTAKVWNTKTYQTINTLIAIDNSDYMNLLPTGYYQCTSNAVKFFHYVTPEMKVISFEQLDVKYNRPDLFLKGIGNTNNELIESYHQAYLKRIHKLNIDTTSFNSKFSFPEGGVKDEPDYEQNQQKIKIHIWFADKSTKIDRYNVWVNDTPIWGQKGITIRKRKQNIFDTIIEITLSDGQNRIETTMMNVNGIESYRSPLFVNYTPENLAVTKTYFIGIGIDHFKDAKYNLTWSSKDIRDMSLAMKNKYGNDIIIDTLFNENVTVENVKALKAKLKKTNVNDRVIIAYSGHGLLSSSFDYYLSTYNVNFNKPEEGGLAYDELENLLDSLPARKKLLMIDACHSGEVDKEEMKRIATISNDTSLHLAYSKGPILLYNANSPKLGTKNSFELMNDLFINVSKGTGATVIAASAGTQFALETNELQNGVFTYCFLQMLKTKENCSVQELKTNISSEVERRTNGAQKPTSRSETSNFDWDVW